jgi:hypothetical protein
MMAWQHLRDRCKRGCEGRERKKCRAGGLERLIGGEPVDGPEYGMKVNL